MVTRNIIPNDMIENLYWGKELQLGYAKHPPLFAWISYFFYRIFFSWPESLYILTQLNLLLGVYFIFKISRLVFVDETKSYAAVLIFLASGCSVFGNEKFNANTILISLLPAVFYFFIRLLKFNKNADAILLGIFSALAFLGKYFALLYMGCMALFLILCKECWSLFRKPQIYIAAAVFLLCISWHLAWICENDFITLKYALDKSANCAKNHFSAFNFLIMQFIFFFTSFWAFAYAHPEKMRFTPRHGYSTEENFIIFITIAPNVLLFLVSVITGMRIGSFWGTNMLTMIGVYLLIINEKIDPNRLFVFARNISVFFAVVLFIKLGIARRLLGEYDPTNMLNIREIAQRIDADWTQKFGDQKMKILKTDKATAALHTHLKDSPSSYDVARCDLFRICDLHPHNKNVVVTFLCDKNDGEIHNFQNLHGENILFENTIHVIKNFFVYYAFVNIRNSHEKN
jgi:4-amino-4-deoxy-L-arabinose transferase-like glycosyltransferase